MITKTTAGTSKLRQKPHLLRQKNATPAGSRQPFTHWHKVKKRKTPFGRSDGNEEIRKSQIRDSATNVTSRIIELLVVDLFEKGAMKHDTNQNPETEQT